MSQILSIALIGAGRTGTPLLQDLLKYDYINILGVADVDAQSPGMQLAAEQKIPCFTDPMALVKAAEQVDILVEVSGDLQLKERIKSHYEETNNRKTLIMHDLIARLLISLCSGSSELTASFHPEDQGIG
ncbi:MAG TPA: hypothetical protein VJY63_11255 [Marinospirillum sp.]|uniref:hypothetical protein n=1 Tax=Marinospirillum sp. TaxID=2183934 RepID=UPI002B47A006|nr:hypothetical protein [Marinospirillum sp.]HKM16479.1 hypothetical protein [Marinospirillum sp.]